MEGIKKGIFRTINQERERERERVEREIGSDRDIWYKKNMENRNKEIRQVYYDG